MFVLFPLRGHLLYMVDMDMSHPERRDFLTSCRGYDEHTASSCQQHGGLREQEGTALPVVPAFPRAAHVQRPGKVGI